MKNKVYTVHAYRYGDKNSHSYPVGIFNKKHAALKAGKDEELHRGGKYRCKIYEWDILNSTRYKTIPSITE